MNLLEASKIVHEWNGRYLEIVSRPQATENSRQYLLLRTVHSRWAPLVKCEQWLHTCFIKSIFQNVREKKIELF